ncbi:MAG TPA: phospholipase D-like domain-containing protein [Candidatus Binatia bacterium]|nr:phospholipase D-like domain-containing protein [Candidatus Binatia bacterium]
MSGRQGSRFYALLFLALLFLLPSCNISINLEPSGGGRVVQTEGPWYNIYFTDPTCPPPYERHDGIDAIIAADLLQAEAYVDVAAFDLDAEPIIDALIQLQAQGVPVRVVTDTDNEELSSITRLRRNGITVVTDDRSALMHDKFIVVDDRVVWTGSLNYTSNGAYCNNNNAVRFDVPELATNYRLEMNEMYDQHQFGPSSPLQGGRERVVVNGVLVENYFAPEEEVAPIIAGYVSGAEEEIHFMAFSFTEQRIGSAMLDRAMEGVEVRGVFETTGSQSEFSYFGRMRDARLPNLHVLQDGNPRVMHHKVIVIDGETVIFGSFNFSQSANDDNDENVVIVHDAQFASYFEEEFDWVWNEAR